jgi:hypothetical protein
LASSTIRRPTRVSSTCSFVFARRRSSPDGKMAISIDPIGEIDTAALARASLVLTPVVLVAARSGISDWLLAAIVAISAYIAMDRCRAPA